MFSTRWRRIFRQGRTSVGDRPSPAARKKSHRPQLDELEDRLVLSFPTNTHVDLPGNAEVGEEVIVDVTVSCPTCPSGEIPTGSVDLFDADGNYLGSYSLFGGKAPGITHQFWDPGGCPDISLTAFYVPDDAQFEESPGNDCIEIFAAYTEIVLESSNNPSVYGEWVTFTATVSVLPPGGGVPTGTVLFLDGTTILGEANLDQAGQAQFATADLSVGRHEILAVYLGNASYHGSTANLVQTVRAHGPAAVLILDAPAVVAANARFMLTVSARDSFGNMDTDYQSTIRFAATDAAASLPADYQFVAADSGTHRFIATLRSPGEQVIWATDTADPTITGDVTITVFAGGAPSSGGGQGPLPAWAARVLVANNPESQVAVPFLVPTQIPTQAEIIERQLKAAARVDQVRREEQPVASTRPVAVALVPGFLEMAAKDGILWGGLVPAWPGALLEEPANRIAR